MILLMIPNRNERHYLTVKKLFALLRGIASQDAVDFYYLKCLYSSRARKNLNCIKKYA